MHMTSVPTYESTLEHYGLTDTQLKEKCRECVLRKLASKLDRWREMAIHLKLEKGVTDSVDGERLEEEGKRYRLLERWTQISGHKATYERLVRCLLEATRADLAEFVCETIKEQLPSVAGACLNSIMDTCSLKVRFLQYRGQYQSRWRFKYYRSQYWYGVLKCSTGSN